jgi:hypothetical protein
VRNIVWTSIIAVSCGVISVLTAVLGADTDIVVGFGALATTTAILSLREQGRL